MLSVNANCVYKVPGAAMVSYRTTWSDVKDKIQAISLALDDLFEYIYDFDFVSGTTTYTRTFSNAEYWQPLFLPFAMNYSDWSDKGEIAQLAGMTAEGALKWTTVSSGSIEAGKPYIFKPSATGEVTFTVNDATVKSCDAKTTLTPKDGYTLNGTYVTKDDMFTSKSYALYNGNFYYTTTDDKKLKPYRIYLNGPVPSSAPILSVIDDEDIAFIEGVETDCQSTCEQAYNLMGMPVDDNYRGIVIVNGKKVVRK